MKTTTQHRQTFDYTIAPDVWGKKDVFVNYYVIKDSQTNNWFLVDAGMKWSAPRIKTMVNELFGEGSRPAAIILTHGHFDHVGALQSLIEEWQVPVYAHSLELPYLTGKSSYPPADNTVGGGLMSTMAFLYPKGPINVQAYIHPLPYDGSIPGLNGWKYIHTPGHSPGHISLFREDDKVLIAGDAIVTTKQESALYALSYKEELSGPPKYFTCNWASAKISVLKLAALNPTVIASGHGHPMYGEQMQNKLQILASRFHVMAQPSHGRYVNEPAITDDTGVVFLPPRPKTLSPLVLAVGFSLGIAAIGFLLYKTVTKETQQNFSVKNTIKKLGKTSRKYEKLKRQLV